MRRPPRDSDRSFLDTPVSVRVHAGILVLFAALAGAVTFDAFFPRHVIDSGMVSDPRALALFVSWGLYGTYFAITTVLRLTRRATLLNYALAVFLTPWAFGLLAYIFSRLS
jgi:hypothetical protein